MPISFLLLLLLHSTCTRVIESPSGRERRLRLGKNASGVSCAFLARASEATGQEKTKTNQKEENRRERSEGDLKAGAMAFASLEWKQSSDSTLSLYPSAQIRIE